MEEKEGGPGKKRGKYRKSEDARDCVKEGWMKGNQETEGNKREKQAERLSLFVCNLGSPPVCRSVSGHSPGVPR